MQEAPSASELVSSLTHVTAGKQQKVHHLFRSPAMSPSALATLLRKAQLKASPHITAIDTELVRRPLSAQHPLPHGFLILCARSASVVADRDTNARAVLQRRAVRRTEPVRSREALLVSAPTQPCACCPSVSPYAT